MATNAIYLRLGPKVIVFIRRPVRSLKHLAAVAGSKIGIQTLAGVVLSVNTCLLDIVNNAE